MQQLKGLFQQTPDDTPFTTAQDRTEDAAINGADAPAADPTVYLPIKSENSLIIVMGILGMALLVSLVANLLLLFNNRALAQR
ncbi:MAG TPA: hypothetical protein V6D20_15945, partial [Candidatus Obscuribacterales bacterium]